MGSNLKARLKAKFIRRSSTGASISSAHSETQTETQHSSQRDEAKSIASADVNRSRPSSIRASASDGNGESPLPAATAISSSTDPASTATDSGTPSLSDRDVGQSVAATAARDTDGPDSEQTTAPDHPLLPPPAAAPAAAPAPAPEATTTGASDTPTDGNDQRPSTSSPTSVAAAATTTATATAAVSQLPSITEDQPLSPLQTSAPLFTAEPESSINPGTEPPPQPQPKAVSPTDTNGVDPLATSSDSDANAAYFTPLPTASSPTASPARPSGPPRRQSLLPNRQTTLIKTLLHQQGLDPDLLLNNNPESLLPINANMVTRKVWVKRTGHGSATLITVNEDDLVDDVRDLILRKYANSLGRHFDSPDLILRLVSREQRQERTLGPEEPVGRTLDAYFPGGQTVDEALVIDTPTRRTPRPSPRAAPAHAVYYAAGADDGRPSEAGEGYFPVVNPIPSPNLPVPVVAQVNGVTTHTTHPVQPMHLPHQPHSIAVLGTGQIPPIPSPGGTRSRAYRDRPERPRLGRTHTSSPTIINTVTSQPSQVVPPPAAASFHPRLPPSRTHSNTSDPNGMPPAGPGVPSPSAAPEPPQVVQRTATPPPRVASPRPSASRLKTKKKTADHPILPPGMLNGGVPPINVLIVEDNPINLKLLEAFVKRLKVRWKTAMNGKEAVDKWKAGGFHLVLMDIQLPIMNGLQATREIRRLERLNSIGVFSSADPSETETGDDKLEDKDRLEKPEMFKSPVIIVALTASSLQSDRHEALAAGCNDFLTKVSSVLPSPHFPAE